MAKIVLATFGSLGDLHPKLAIGLELKRRGYDVTIAAMEFYREKVTLAGLKFAPMAPHLEPGDKALARDLMDEAKGPENILRGLISPNVRQMYDDIVAAVEGADVLVTGEVVWAAKSVAETTGVKWVSTSVAPISFFSSYDPPIPPQASWYEHLLFLGPKFHWVVMNLAKRQIRGWYGEYKEFRRSLSLDPDHDPLFDGKYSDLLHLAIFSKVLSRPQPDWPPQTVQTGFCFYDGQADMGIMPAGLAEFLGAGEPPVVFTLGSAAVMDPRDFFEESIKAAKLLGRRAVMLFGVFNERPKGLTNDVVGFDYAPYSLVFPKAACVVHQAGVGTTGQVLRAGVPNLIMPYGHDQPDNAARCRRLGVAEIIRRNNYNAESASAALRKILADSKYASRAAEIAKVVSAERGTAAACDAIETVLRK